MTDALAPIITKLATFVRLLSSDKDGEIVAAAHAIKRTLKSTGADIHTLAECIEKPNGSGLTEAEMKKLYDAGFNAGMREAEDHRYGSADFHNIDGTPHRHEIALYSRFRGGGGSEHRVVALATAAARLLRAYSVQVETLRRLRHGGDQYVRVEHVHVNDGGQAVIGNVKTAGSGAAGSPEHSASGVIAPADQDR